MSEREKARQVDVDGEAYVCNDEDYEIELNYLKAKCDAGGDVIITQVRPGGLDVNRVGAGQISPLCCAPFMQSRKHGWWWRAHPRSEG